MSVKPEPGTLFIVIRHEGEPDTKFKVKPTTKMSKVFNSYLARVGKAKGTLEFMVDGERIDEENDTPKTLELENEHIIDAVAHQTGGFLSYLTCFQEYA